MPCVCNWLQQWKDQVRESPVTMALFFFVRIINHYNGQTRETIGMSSWVVSQYLTGLMAKLPSMLCRCWQSLRLVLTTIINKCSQQGQLFLLILFKCLFHLICPYSWRYPLLLPAMLEPNHDTEGEGPQKGPSYSLGGQQRESQNKPSTSWAIHLGS